MKEFICLLVLSLVFFQVSFCDLASLMSSSAALLGAPNVDDNIMDVAALTYEIRNMVKKNWLDAEVSQSFLDPNEILPDGFIRGEIVSQLFPNINAYYEGSSVIEVETGLVIPHGFGKASYDDDTTYIGLFNFGHREGPGYFNLASGDKYLGQFNHNIEHGLGNRTYRRDGWYAGAWEKGKPEGVGRRVWGSGNVYSGSWKRGKTHGVGELAYANGDKYTGHWKRGEEDGYGTHVYKESKEAYVGIWKKGFPDGYGKFSFGSGDYYLGNWKNGSVHGLGQYFYNNTGDSFYGYHKNGLKHGAGEYHIPSAGIALVGKWKHGKRDGDTKTEALEGRGFGFSLKEKAEPQEKTFSTPHQGKDLLDARSKRRRPGYPNLEIDQVEIF